MPIVLEKVEGGECQKKGTDIRFNSLEEKELMGH